MKKLQTKQGGLFVTAPGGRDAIEREPRVRTPQE
jgi:hypothetical protein